MKNMLNNRLCKNVVETLAGIFLLHFFLLTFAVCQKTNEIKDLRSNPIGIGSSQDFIRVDLGISESNPNTRIVNYVDVNSDKL